jgi:hypothetical protein
VIVAVIRGRKATVRLDDHTKAKEGEPGSSDAFDRSDPPSTNGLSDLG